MVTTADWGTVGAIRVCMMKRASVLQADRWREHMGAKRNIRTEKSPTQWA